MNNENYVNEWIDKAKKDIKAVEIIREYDEMTEIVCFHCQQAAEKYLKALLLSKNEEITKTHNIDFLLKKCSKYNEDFISYIGSPLADYAVDIRHSEVRYIPSKQEMEDAIILLEGIIKLVEKCFKEE